MHLLISDVIIHRIFNHTAKTGVECVDQHQAGFFLQRHLRDQIIGALVNRQTPVLVRVESTVGIGILELQAIDIDDGLGAGTDLGLIDRGRIVIVIIVASGNPKAQGKGYGQNDALFGKWYGRAGQWSSGEVFFHRIILELEGCQDQCRVPAGMVFDKPDVLPMTSRFHSSPTGTGLNGG